MNKKTFKTKKYIILFSLGALFFAFFVITILRAYFRPIEYQVHVSSQIYNQYIKGKNFSDLPFVFINEEEISKINFFGKIPILAASINLEKSIPLITQEQKSNTISYTLSTSYILPIIENDFNHLGTSKDSIFYPNLSIGFSLDQNIPNNTRALLVNNLYAGQADYELTLTNKAVCTFYLDLIKEPLQNWCNKNFANNQTKNANEQTLQKPVFISSVGDMMVGRGVENILINDKDGIKKVFTSTLPVLQNNDITIGNLEGVVTESSQNAIKTYTFKFNKKVLPFLQKAGFNYFMQTNNHCYDYGEQGFKDTLKAFSEYNIASSGIGYNEDEAKNFYHTTINGQKFAIISCGAYPVENSGFNGQKTATATKNRAGILWLTDEVYELVKKEKQEGNFVIVNVHGGQEYVFSPSKTQIESYKKLCDFGADVVLGSHPHVLQKNEWYNNSLIVYSQGNFIFNGMDGMNGATQSEIIRLGILNGKIIYTEVYPAKINGTSVSLVE